jgi:hypothetical protein
MSVMGQITLEREGDLQAAKLEYDAAWDAYSQYMTDHPIEKRKLPEWNQLFKLEYLAMDARQKYERAKWMRTRL